MADALGAEEGARSRLSGAGASRLCSGRFCRIGRVHADASGLEHPVDCPLRLCRRLEEQPLVGTKRLDPAANVARVVVDVIA
jgi:hypothetical protein